MIYTIQQTLESHIVFQSHACPNSKFKHDMHLPYLPFHVVSIKMIGPLSTAIVGYQLILIAVFI